jgi:hypothetical protein
MGKEIFGITVGWFILIIVLVLSAVVGVVVWQQFEQGMITKDYQNVKHSQAVVGATNDQIRTAISEYAAAAAEYNKYAKSDEVTAKGYEGQMKAALNNIYRLAGSIDKSELQNDNAEFMATHPNTVP